MGTSRKRQIGNFVTAVVVFGVFTTIVFAQQLRVTTGPNFPVGDLVKAIREQLNWRVTFEDAPVFYEGYIRQGRPNGIPRREIFDDPISVSINVDRRSPNADRIALIRGILEGRRKGGRASYSAVPNGDYIHIVPAAVANSSGVLEPFVPMLDTKISLPYGRYNLLALVENVLAEVSKKRNVPIAILYFPVNLFAQSFVTEEAFDEPARVILIRAFETINSPRIVAGVDPLRLTWYMPYDPETMGFYFNVNNMPLEDNSPGDPNAAPGSGRVPPGRGGPGKP